MISSDSEKGLKMFQVKFYCDNFFEMEEKCEKLFLEKNSFFFLGFFGFYNGRFSGEILL